MCLCVCSSSPFLDPWELVPEIWVSFVFLKVLLLLLRLTINKHSQIKQKSNRIYTALQGLDTSRVEVHDPEELLVEAGSL